MNAAPTQTLVNRISTLDRPIAQAAAIVAGAALTALCAQVSIPWWPVPFTLQTLAVVLTGVALGSRLGLASQATYLLAGLAGAPVFAEFKAGPAALLGPTGGYLIGFLAMAYLCGLAAERGQDRKPLALALHIGLAHLALYACGALWLSLFLPGGLPSALAAGVLPFLLGDFVKSIVAAAAVPAAWKLFPVNTPVNTPTNAKS